MEGKKKKTEKLGGQKWYSAFAGASNVKDLCEILDKTSRPIFDTTTSHIIFGFFSFSLWAKAIVRTINNIWHKRNRYSCLRDLWHAMTKKAKEIMEVEEIAKKLRENKVDTKLIENYVRLTLSLSARTHRDVESNYKHVDRRTGAINTDKSARSRWNEKTRNHVVKVLKDSKIEIGEKKTKISWYELLEKIPPLGEKVIGYCMGSADSFELEDLKPNS